MTHIHVVVGEDDMEEMQGLQVPMWMHYCEEQALSEESARESVVQEEALSRLLQLFGPETLQLD